MITIRDLSRKNFLQGNNIQTIIFWEIVRMLGKYALMLLLTIYQHQYMNSFKLLRNRGSDYIRVIYDILLFRILLITDKLREKGSISSILSDYYHEAKYVILMNKLYPWQNRNTSKSTTYEYILLYHMRQHWIPPWPIKWATDIQPPH